MRARFVIIALLVCASIVAVYAGIRLRKHLYESTANIHFANDARNAWGWGRNARATGLFNLYECVEEGQPIRSVYDLDYAPLRLAVAMTWHSWTRQHFPDTRGFSAEYEFIKPMLWGNTIAALVSSVLAFLLIRMWVIRMDDARRPPDLPARAFRGVATGMIGAMLLWFNPAALWDGYVWGQWEIWIIPFYLGAVWLACLDRWFAAGVCLAMGALLKPQLLVAAPVLFIWPICQIRFDALFRLVAGLAIAVAITALPWFKLSPASFVWYMLALGAATLLSPMVLRWKLGGRWLMVLAMASLLLAWPWTSDASLAMRALPVAMIGCLMLARFLPARLLPHVYALLVAALIALTIPLYSAKTGWFTRGFTRGPETRWEMFQRPVYNVPAMGVTYLRWPNDTRHRVDAPLIGDISLWALMIVLQGICLVLCGIGAAIHYGRNDTRFLIAIALPWLTFYMFLTQQQSRYLMWAAAVCCLLIADSAGFALLGILIGILGLLSIDATLHQAAGQMQRFRYVQSMDPHVGWLLLLVTLIMFYHALSPRGRNPGLPVLSPAGRAD